MVAPPVSRPTLLLTSSLTKLMTPATPGSLHPVTALFLSLPGAGSPPQPVTTCLH